MKDCDMCNLNGQNSSSAGKKSLSNAFRGATQAKNVKRVEESGKE